MLEAEAKQFRLTDDGRITYQQDRTNPTPGIPVACVKKGGALFVPEIALIPEAVPDGLDHDQVTLKIKTWLSHHIDEVLAPLKTLAEVAASDETPAPAKTLAWRICESLGIVLRQDIEELIAELDPAGRAALRRGKVRLGPVLVFLPLLNKPAAVHIRALLWSLWRDKPLPAPLPPDGMVSLKLPAEAEINPDFYRSIGYPVYGGRAIRVDMLDRLIGAIYDSAEKGVFDAQHKMAEWLGCPIADLYAVIESMGHTKIHDPADDVKPEEEKPEEPKQDTQTEGETESVDNSVEKTEDPAVPASPERPKLARFRLKRGKAFAASVPEAKKDRPPRKPRANEERKQDGKDGPSAKPHHGPKDGHKHKHKKEKDRKPHHKHGKDRERRDEPRIIRAEAQKKMEDSPFAILQQLIDPKD